LAEVHRDRRLPAAVAGQRHLARHLKRAEIEPGGPLVHLDPGAGKGEAALAGATLAVDDPAAARIVERQLDILALLRRQHRLSGKDCGKPGEAGLARDSGAADLEMVEDQLAGVLDGEMSIVDRRDRLAALFAAVEPIGSLPFDDAIGLGAETVE